MKKTSTQNRLLLIIFILIFGSGFMSLLTSESKKMSSNVVSSGIIEVQDEFSFNLNLSNNDNYYFVYDPINNEKYIDYLDSNTYLDVEVYYNNNWHYLERLENPLDYRVIELPRENITNIRFIPYIKNLAMPDLTDKEYLGDGVYRIDNRFGVTIDYNVYNGNFIVNGTPTSNVTRLGGVFNIPIDTYSFSFYKVSGTSNVDTLYYNGETLEQVIVMRIRDDDIIYNNNVLTKSTIISLLFSDYTRSEYVNYTFKLQIEKGDTATAYEVPKIDYYNYNLNYSIQKGYYKPIVRGSDFEIMHDFTDVKQMNKFGIYIMTKNSFGYFIETIKYFSNFSNIFLEVITTTLGYIGEALSFIMKGINEIVDFLKSKKDILGKLPRITVPVLPVIPKWKFW